MQTNHILNLLLARQCIVHRAILGHGRGFHWDLFAQLVLINGEAQSRFAFGVLSKVESLTYRIHHAYDESRT